ncbi:ABC transporter permease [Marinivivus vitaminiproducens]|uniref:ABC transporter permease n=1 Tax=Marinivivus vitaminiproducens TaxID=3035935 RepID=UPI0027A73AB4|nr:iron ABC transporter permease [Geminicoccaceae bacterium SCSIO 64248]
MAVGGRTLAERGPARASIRAGRLDRWSVAAALLALVLALPVLAVIATAFGDAQGIWSHLAGTLLPRYVGNSLLLIALVGLGSLVVGTGAAWLVSACRFPGRGLLEWALVLPLAMPAYIVAFVYSDLLDYAGPVQSWLRATFGWRAKSQYWFPQVRSLGGAAVVLTLVLYPYVYLLARSAFLGRSRSAIEASRVLGRGPWPTFLRVALPMARPAIVAGLSLVAMETLADFGTVAFFAVPTFTTGIYDVWLNMYNATGAAQLATALLVFVLAALALERRSRSERGFVQTMAGRRSPAALPLGRAQAVLAVLFCALPILFGFVLPAVLLLVMAIGQGSYHGVFVVDMTRSLALAGGAAALTVGCALFLACGLRLRGGAILGGATRLAATGYAVPGSVIAVGVLLPFAWIDNTIDALARDLLGTGTGLILSGTAFAVLFAYVVRFLAVALGAVESGLARIGRHLDDAARTLGEGPGGTLMRVQLPLLKGAVTTGLILVFVDGMKELPATLLLRPFGFDTLATRVYELASDQRYEEASLPALAIVAVGILPVVILVRAMRPRPTAA